MKNFLILIFFLMSFNSLAGIVLSIGPLPTAGTETTDNKASNDKSFLQLNQTTGLTLGAELPMSFLSLATSLSYTSQNGTSQFVRSNGAIIPDLKSKADSYLASASLRLRFINFKRFKMFIGGGPTFGNVQLLFNKADYTSKGGPLSEYKTNERFSSYGGHVEIGSEWIIDKKQAVRGYVNLISTKTTKINSFDDKSISLGYAQFGLEFLFYFDWKFRRSKD